MSSSCQVAWHLNKALYIWEIFATTMINSEKELRSQIILSLKHTVKTMGQSSNFHHISQHGLDVRNQESEYGISVLEGKTHQLDDKGEGNQGEEAQS